MNSDHAVLLAIDTSLGSLAAVAADRGVVERRSADPLAHAEVIGDLVSEALAAAGLDRGDITHVVMGTGPGPFTGLRIGMAAARGFAIGAAVPLLPVISHEGVAYAELFDKPLGTKIRVIQDARRKELFVSSWQLTDSGVTMTAQPAVVPRKGFAASDHDHWHEAVSGAGLIAVAKTRLATGGAFASADPLYLRDPDVRQPVPLKPNHP